MMDQPTLICHRCGAELRPGRGDWYVVRVEAFADPTPPHIDMDELAERDLEAEMAGVIEELSQQSEQEIRDDVHRRLTLHLCRRCYRAWIENPAG